jgi:hypothetical protein
LKVVIHDIPYRSRSDWFEFWPLGDIHWGNGLCDEHALREDVKRIRDTEHAYWGGMGDYCDFINRSDNRFQESHIAEWLWGLDDILGPQIESLANTLAPIKDKCLWMLRGNHEDCVLKRFERDVYYELCRAMGLSEHNRIALGYRGFVVIRMRRGSRRKPAAATTTYTVFAHHGYGGGRLPGSKALKLGRLPTHYLADLYLYGHQHDRMINPPMQRLRPTKVGTIAADTVYTCMTGTYLHSYDQLGQKEVYSEVKNLPPSGIGAIRVRVKPDTKEVRVTI